jgi:hypothetical protein
MGVLTGAEIVVGGGTARVRGVRLVGESEHAAITAAANTGAAKRFIVSSELEKRARGGTCVLASPHHGVSGALSVLRHVFGYSKSALSWTVVSAIRRAGVTHAAE